jgi:hypothetical protein
MVLVDSASDLHETRVGTKQDSFKLATPQVGWPCSLLCLSASISQGEAQTGWGHGMHPVQEPASETPAQVTWWDP